MNTVNRLFPVLCAALAAVWITFLLVDHSDSAMRLDEFGKTPVQDGGRIKPIDTVARLSLLTINGEQKWTDTNNKRQPAIKWLLEVMSDGLHGAPLDYRVFSIANPDLLTLLGLERRPHLHYAISEFRTKLGDLEREANRVAKQESVRSPYEKAVAELANHVKLYIGLATGRAPRMFPPAHGKVDRDPWSSLADVNDAAEQLVDSRWDQFVARFMEQRGQKPEDVDKLTKDQKAELATLKDDAVAVIRDRMNPTAGHWQEILTAYRAGDSAAFNKALEKYESSLDTLPNADRQRSSFEAFFNDFSPFYRSVALYLTAFLLACVSWLGWHRPLARAAIAVMAIGMVVHGFGLFGRMYLSDRWLVFVTNLYSSAVFIGFGAALAGIILELIYRRGIGVAIGSFVGFSAILVGGMIVKGEDTLEMMRAVLDTNFWLATHVTCVTIGYTATFVAGMTGIAYLVAGLFTTALRDRQLEKALSQMTYGVICFAMLFSFTGTVLGGIWADYSWGRFWGWDPKENGALLIVLWNALILHARWAGMVKHRGTAVLAIVGNMITAWSYFGTNQLGIGLHSYGFDDSLSPKLTLFWASQLLLIALGLIPLRYWASFSSRPAGSLT